MFVWCRPFLGVDHFLFYCFCQRLAAHHPEAFHSHTHLIIDEIHERSVDTDLLCYMTRRLLEMHPRLKLVVMSATLNTATYANYFGIPEDEYLFGKKPPFFTESWFVGTLEGTTGGIASTHT